MATPSGYFVTGSVSSTTQLRNGWITQRVHLVNLAKQSRIAETDKVLNKSVATVCKNEALDVVKTATHKRGFELAQIVRRMRVDGWDVVARVHESSKSWSCYVPQALL